MKKYTTKDKSIAYISGIFFIFLVWVIISLIIHNEAVLPNVPLTFKALGNLLGKGETYGILGHTILRLFIAMTISFTLALIMALLTIKFPLLRNFLSPGIGLVKTLPNIIIIIIMLVVFSNKIAVYVITCFVIFPILYEGAYLGFSSIDKDALEDIKTVSNLNFTVARKVYVPLALPSIFASLLQSFGLGIKVSVMAEYISKPNNSIGKELWIYKDYSYEIEYVLAWALILIIFVLLVEFVIHTLKKKLIDF